MFYSFATLLFCAAPFFNRTHLRHRKSLRTEKGNSDAAFQDTVQAR